MLRRIRITLACVFFIGLALLFLDFTGTAHHWLSWMAKVQALEAVLAINVVVVVLLVLLTLVFGRIYCSIICPLGVMQDVFGWMGKKAKKNRYTFSKEVKWLRYGVLAMALGQLFCDILAQLINAWPNKKLLGYPYWTQLKDLLPCLLLSLVMAGLVAAVQLLGLHDLVTLLIQVPLGALVYVLGARLLKLDSFDYILNMAKTILQKRRAGENR